MIKTTAEKAEILERFSDMEGTEIADIWRSLSYLYNYKNCYILTEKFRTTISEEVNAHFESALIMIEEGTLDIPVDILDDLGIEVTKPSVRVFELPLHLQNLCDEVSTELSNKTIEERRELEVAFVERLLRN